MEAPQIPVDLILSKLAEDTEEFQKRLKKGSDVLLDKLDTQIATTPYDIEYEEDRVKLKHYRPVTEPSLKTPLLVVYALINRETMLDLQPGRSVVQSFLEKGKLQDPHSDAPYRNQTPDLGTRDKCTHRQDMLYIGRFDQSSHC